MNGEVRYFFLSQLEQVTFVDTMDDLTTTCRQFSDKSASLTLLDLSGQGLGTSGIKSLSHSCTHHHGESVSRRVYVTPLVCLWLENNYLNTSAANILSELIEASPYLKFLYLAHNSVGNKGAKIIADTSFCKLQACNLADNEIGLAGARALAETLSNPCCVLETLVLDSNYLRDEGVFEIIKALRTNTSLKVLDLRYNYVTHRGLMALRDVLKFENKTIQFLYLEEDEDEDCLPEQEPPRPKHLGPSTVTFNNSKRPCPCRRCRLRDEIAYYLALNRGGRHIWASMETSMGLWPRILAKSSHDDPSLIYAGLTERPDIATI